MSLPSMGAAADDFLSAPSVFICGLPVARSQRARERSIRLFIQRFIVVNLPTYFSMSCYPELLARSIRSRTSFLRTCRASHFPERRFPNFPASAYLLTRKQQGKGVISPWKIWTNTTTRIHASDTPLSAIVFRHTISLAQDSKSSRVMPSKYIRRLTQKRCAKLRKS